nr:receptor-type guanylate cyclase gcy-15-like [Biomphalaria glabrata]
MKLEVDSHSDALVASVSVMEVTLIIFPLVILAVTRFTNRIQAYTQTLQERTRDLDVEKKTQRDASVGASPSVCGSAPVESPDRSACHLLFGYSRL